jgi:hypothetical protein
VKGDGIEGICNMHGQMKNVNYIFVGRTDGKKSLANLEVK